MKWYVSDQNGADFIDNLKFDAIDQIMDLTDHSPDEILFSTMKQVQQYFIGSEGVGHQLYRRITQEFDRIMIQLLKSVNIDNLTFDPPYNQKELAILWISLNITSELLDWIVNILRERQRSENPIFSSVIAPLLDLLTLMISLRMRELTESEIYGRILEDREKWGFLLKDMETQTLAQLLSVVFDLGSLTSMVFNSKNLISTLQSMTEIGMTGLNIHYIRQAYQGLMEYSSKKESIGWIAWLIQELDFLTQDDFLPRILGQRSPITLGIVENILMIVTMGLILYQD